MFALALFALISGQSQVIGIIPEPPIAPMRFAPQYEAEARSLFSAEESMFRECRDARTKVTYYFAITGSMPKSEGHRAEDVKVILKAYDECEPARALLRKEIGFAKKIGFETLPDGIASGSSMLANAQGSMIAIYKFFTDAFIKAEAHAQ